MNNMGWKADSLNIKQSCKEYARSLGIDNSPVIRQATAEEMQELAKVKPYKRDLEADSYVIGKWAKTTNTGSIDERKKFVRSPSTVNVLKQRGKIYCGNRA